LLRNSVRTNFNFSPADWISFGVNSSLALVNNEALNSQQIYREAVLLAPNLPIYNPDGSFFYNSKQNDVFYNSVSRDQGNPVALAHEENYVKDTRIISNYYAELKPVSWLRLKTEFGLDVYNSKSYNRQYEKPSLKGGSASAGNKQNIKYVINNVLSFRKMFDKHMVNAILGQSFERSEENSMRVTGDQFFDDNEKSIQAARRKRVMNAIEREWAVVSYFTRINYRFNDRYLAGFTYRVDGSSRFSKNERYRGFPSFSAGWILNEESFMSNTKHWLNDLKLRASYGLTGLDGSFGGYYGNQGVWTRLTASGNTLNYNDVPLLYNEQPVNPNLEWETTTSLDLGLDAVLFDNKLELTLDYFHKQTKNLLASDYVPLYMGWSTQQQNIGDMKSEGIELSVNGTLLKTKDWNWTGSFNISHITDKLTKLNEQGYQMMRSSGIERKVFVVGESLNQFYMYDWVKVDPQTGDPLWRYGDGSIQSVPPQAISSKQDSPLANRYASGSSMPDFYGGFTSNLVYKNWELNATFSYSLGQKMFNGTQSSLMTYHLNDRNNLSTDILDYWKIPGHKTGVPRLDNATTNYQSDDPYSNNKSRQGYDVSRLNDRFLEDASYLRLRTVTLSYTFNQNWVKKLYMDRVRVYGQAMNLLTITGYSGIDPEVNAYGSSAILGGYDEITLPQAKSFKFGVDISF
jgi:TonB-linked SusC/RagA family outer membrane protein